MHQCSGITFNGQRLDECTSSHGLREARSHHSNKILIKWIQKEENRKWNEKGKTKREKTWKIFSERCSRTDGADRKIIFIIIGCDFSSTQIDAGRTGHWMIFGISNRLYNENRPKMIDANAFGWVYLWVLVVVFGIYDGRTSSTLSVGAS